MPYEGPGERYSVIATKAAIHGRPAVENGHGGIAAKSSQAAPATVSTANATAAQAIAIGEEMVIMMHGVHEVPSALLPGGAIAGTPLWIVAADNSLANAAAAGRTKFGIVDSIDAVLGRALVNLTQRSSF
jgi:hypothetical protein